MIVWLIILEEELMGIRDSTHVDREDEFDATPVYVISRLN